MEILSQLWSFLGLLTVLQNILPSQFLSLLNSLYESLQDLFTPFSHFDIPEFNGYCSVDQNELYRHVTLYLNSLHNPTATAVSSSAAACRRLSLSRSKSSNRISFAVAPNHSIHDSFNGDVMSWTHHVETVQDSLDEKRSFSLKIPKRSRHALLPAYLDHVTLAAAEFERTSRERRLFTNSGNGNSYESGWVSVPFRHPSTFETLALETELKKQITDDLTAFSAGREFYNRVGRAWKRGYLLYGPPGSGKSSLIAAMANFLCFDVYDLELTKVSDNSELRSLLIQTTNRSVIVIEDIDCSVDLTADRVSKETAARVNHEEEMGRVTLSGLLNFTDGLWSCCGEERIVVFTTNYREKIDPALIRCGRMDVHVSLGTCGPAAFRSLVRNYLRIESHALFDVVDGCIRSGGGLTPAQIAEILLRNRRDADVAMREVVAALQARVMAGGGGRVEYEEMVMRSPESVLMVGSPEIWDSSPGKYLGKKRKEGSAMEKKVNFLVRLRSLTKSDSGKRGA